MIDWYIVEFLYPESFKRFTTVMFPYVGIISLSTLECYDIKKLYQFFDHEGVYLTVERYHTDQWAYTISLSNGLVFGPEQESRFKREDIERDGFLECFKLLDKILRDKL